MTVSTTFDSPAPKVQITLTVDAELAKYYLMLYLLIEGDTIDQWHWMSYGPDMVTAWHFAGDVLVDTCGTLETLDLIDQTLVKLISAAKQARLSFESDSTPPTSTPR